MEKHYVIVRTHAAGVHFGVLISREGKEVRLEDSRRIYRWEGALSCSELATRGCKEGSKLGDPVSITLTEAIEIIDCTRESAECLTNFRRWQ